ncbi:Fe-S oxidoreductase [Bacillus sp. TS-2]|nr:Fe-S oxidoreductase [Bacillus sp. TS-2]
MFYGFLLVQFGAIDLIWKGLSPHSHLPLGPFYPGFVFLQEIIVVLILIAVAAAFYRRYIEKLPRLKKGFKAGLVLLFISVLMVSKLLAKAMHLIWYQEAFLVYEPIASSIAYLFSFLPTTIAIVSFYVFWWIHLLCLLCFLLYIPQSKHAHLIAGPINVFLGRTEPVGKLSTISFEDENVEKFGNNEITDFNQKQLLDLYACVECGRCTAVCPASYTGKKLSPMDLITKMRDHLTEKGQAVTSRTAWFPKGALLAQPNEYSSTEQSASLIGDVISEEEIWACTTCRNCEEECPVMNEHVDKIIDMRRYLVMTEGKMEAEAKRALTQIERYGNPWGFKQKDRSLWTDDLQIRTAKDYKKEQEEYDYLFFVGSMAAYELRSQKIARSLIRVLHSAGLKVAILGNKEGNSGDIARRLGNEFLYQQLVMANIEQFKKQDVKKIVTIDPHAFNTFKNEYPEFGLKDVQVYHHTELLAKLIQDKKIRPIKEVNETIVYHDSCYLGRYNEVYEPPREILKAIPGVILVEMDKSRERSMCCGAGGGLMWMEERVGKRVQVERTEQALAASPTVISTACPYCMSMISDGTKSLDVEQQVETYDIVEILEKSLP